MFPGLFRESRRHLCETGADAPAKLCWQRDRVYRLAVKSLGSLIHLATIRDALVEVRILIASRPFRASRRWISRFAGRKLLVG